MSKEITDEELFARVEAIRKRQEEDPEGYAKEMDERYEKVLRTKEYIENGIKVSPQQLSRPFTI